MTTSPDSDTWCIEIVFGSIWPSIVTLQNVRLTLTSPLPVKAQDRSKVKHIKAAFIEFLQTVKRHLNCNSWWGSRSERLHYAHEAGSGSCSALDIRTMSEQAFTASSKWMRGSSAASFMYRYSIRWPLQNNERPAKLRASPVSQLAVALILGFGIVFSRNMPSGKPQVSFWWPSQHFQHFCLTLGLLLIGDYCPGIS